MASDLIRRAARIARAHARPSSSASTSRRPTGSPATASTGLDEHRRLSTDLGGTYREVVDTDVAQALVRTAVAENATQLVLGASRRSRWNELVQGSVVNTISKHADDALDIHIIATRPPDDDVSTPTPGAARAAHCPA